MPPRRWRTGSASSPRAIPGDGEDDARLDRPADRVGPADVAGQYGLVTGHRCPRAPRRNQPARTERPPPDRGRARGDRVQAASGPRFRQVVEVPRRGLGGPLWVDAPAFDLGDHARVLLLPADTGEAALLLAVERLRRQRLDRSRPLWEMWFLPGLPDKQIALFVRLHHSIADGMAAISAFLDPVPDAPAPARPWTPTRPPSAPALLADNLARHLGRLASAVAVLARPRRTARRLRRRGRRRTSSSPKRPRPRPAWTAWSVAAATWP